VLITAFFFLSLFYSGCSSKIHTPSPVIKIIPDSIVLYNLNASCLAKKYFPSADVVFFPFLEINKSGQLTENYNQNFTQSKDSSYLNSKFEFQDPIIQVVASRLVEKFKFNGNIYIKQIPNDIRSAYFFKFYYHTNEINDNRYNIFLSCSVEYFDSENADELLKSVWNASSHYNFNNNVAINDAKKIAFKHLMSFFLKTTSSNSQFNIYNN
tara:strand:- start:283 stop:915 length:633 start_codon:yes stop_codon:yes gene_type:complete